MNSELLLLGILVMKEEIANNVCEGGFSRCVKSYLSISFGMDRCYSGERERETLVEDLVDFPLRLVIKLIWP